SGIHAAWGIGAVGRRGAASAARAHPAVSASGSNVFTVKSAADDGGSDTLRSVVAAAAQSAPAVVNFDPSLAGQTINLVCGRLVYIVVLQNPITLGNVPCWINVPAGVSIDGQSNNIAISGSGMTQIFTLNGNNR